MFPLLVRHGATRWIAPLCASALLSACSAPEGDTGADGTEPEVTAVPVLSGTEPLEFPLDAYEATGEEQRTLDKAQGVLTTRCMARFGFTYRAPEQAGTGGTQRPSRRFGVTDMETASRYGYLNPGTVDPPEPSKPSELTTSEELALLGGPEPESADLPASQEEAERKGGSGVRINKEEVPVGGCVRESFLKLYAPKPESVDLLYVFNLRGQADTAFREDSRVREVNSRWSDCMAESGYTVSDPHTPTDELGISDDRVSSPEAITAAKADVACKQRVNLVGVYHAALSAYEQRLVEKNAETLKTAKDQLGERLRLAAELTG